MATDQEIRLTLLVSTQLGIFGRTLATIEPQIDMAIKAVLERQEEDPENISVPIMMNLLIAAKDLIKAHKTIERVAEMIMTGGMTQEGTERLQ